MTDQNQGKIKGIIQKEIQLEDDMLALYSGLLKTDEFLNNLSVDDKNLVSEIITSLLRDTERHKTTMQEIINGL
ncbi:MAG: hypothetical protein WCX08_03950 [Candidatus Buchananbacteria bacterium]|jgi:hypothetical protein